MPFGLGGGGLRQQGLFRTVHRFRIQNRLAAECFQFRAVGTDKLFQRVRMSGLEGGGQTVYPVVQAALPHGLCVFRVADGFSFAQQQGFETAGGFQSCLRFISVRAVNSTAAELVSHDQVGSLKKTTLPLSCQYFFRSLRLVLHRIYE